MTKSSRQGWIYGALAVFAIFVTIYFYQALCITEDTWRWIIALPTLTLAALTLRFSKTTGLLIPMALLASTVGDYYGSEGVFLLQVGFFALAHLFYIGDFFPSRAINAKRVVGATLFTLAAAAYIGYIIYNLTFGVEAIAIGLYGVIIALMGISAIVQQRRFRSIYILAALLFIVSDSIIAYGFIGTVPHATIWIMSTYYLAQLLFATLALTRKSPKA